MRTFLSIVLVAFLAGCVADTKSATTPTGDTKVVKVKIDGDVLAAIQRITKIGVNTGLKEWAKKEPQAAQETATRLSLNISTELLPYLKGDKLLSSAEVSQLLQASIFDKVPEPVKSTLIAAASVLDYYLPIPDAKTYMTKNDIKLVQAFLQGIKDGCDEFKPVSNAKMEARQWVKSSK